MPFSQKWCAVSWPHPTTFLCDDLQLWLGTPQATSFRWVFSTGSIPHPVTFSSGPYLSRSWQDRVLAEPREPGDLPESLWHNRTLFWHRRTRRSNNCSCCDGQWRPDAAVWIWNPTGKRKLTDRQQFSILKQLLGIFLLVCRFVFFCWALCWVVCSISIACDIFKCDFLLIVCRHNVGLCSLMSSHPSFIVMSACLQSNCVTDLGLFSGFWEFISFCQLSARSPCYFSVCVIDNKKECEHCNGLDAHYSSFAAFPIDFFGGRRCYRWPIAIAVCLSAALCIVAKRCKIGL